MTGEGATIRGLGHVSLGGGHFEHGQNDVRPHISVSLVYFMSNWLKGSKTLHLQIIEINSKNSQKIKKAARHLLSVFHLIWHIFLHSKFIKFIHSCLEYIIFSNSVHHIDSAVALNRKGQMSKNTIPRKTILLWLRQFIWWLLFIIPSR